MEEFNMIHTFDAYFYSLMQTIQTHLAVDRILNPICIGASWLGDNGLLWVVIALVLLCFKRTRKVGIVVAAALCFDIIIVNGLLKHIVDRTRPYFSGEFEWLTQQFVSDRGLISFPSDSSFPSGHTASAFASAVGIFACNKKWGIPAIIAAIIIGFSRMYLYVHYPSDVFAGVIVGIICGILAYYTVKLILRWMEKSGKFPKLYNFITYQN
jgi:undecaprenyl-diphosphatase